MLIFFVAPPPQLLFVFLEAPLSFFRRAPLQFRKFRVKPVFSVEVMPWNEGLWSDQEIAFSELKKFTVLCAKGVSKTANGVYSFTATTPYL